MPPPDTVSPTSWGLVTRAVKKNPGFFDGLYNSTHQISKMSIHFNSKSSHKWHILSNFYGSVEFEYQQSVAVKGVDKLFAEFQTCDSKQFLHYLKLLQPKKKKWTPLMEAYWFRGGEPIRGILAKLVAGARDNPRRFKVIKNLIPEFTILPEATVQEKKDAMLRTLRKKFRHPQYRNLLLSSGSRAIHEKPMRGKGGLWTYMVDKAGNKYGDDLLGQLLMQVRQELRQELAATPSQNRHKRRRTPDVIDLTGSGDTPVNKRAANETQVQVQVSNGVETVLKMIKCVRERANARLDDNIGDTPVPHALIEVASALNSLYTDFAGPYLDTYGDRWTEVGAQEILACMDDGRPFGQLLRAVREDQ